MHDAAMDWIPRLDARALGDFMRDRFPPGHFTEGVDPWTIDHVGPGSLSMTLLYRPDFLRPGGTISGPTIMMLVDTAMYLHILSHIGPVELAVTSSLHIDFLRRAPPGDVVATTELLKLGRLLANGRVTVRAAGDPRPVAHATVTYALPATAPT
jgi:acyl-coenzyme A thioesterase PaaI-like protein